MFAYCENNPVIYYDDAGLYTFLCNELGGNPATANKANNTSKPAPKYREIGSVSASGGWGPYMGVEETVVKDDKGNYYSVTTFKLGGGFGGKVEKPSIKDIITLDALSPIDVDNIYDLQGWSYTMGGTLGIIGIEWDGSTDPSGIDWSVAGSLGLDVHLTANYTMVKQIYKAE